MIIDKIENLEKYAALNPLFRAVADFVRNNDLNALPLGLTEIIGKDLFVNTQQTQPKTKEMAKMESHDKYIDIQVPLSAPEVMGYTPRVELPEAPYNEGDDISFYEGYSKNYFTIEPGMFAIFFPQDAHAPAISETGVHKMIFKVLV